MGVGGREFVRTCSVRMNVHAQASYLAPILQITIPCPLIQNLKSKIQNQSVQS